MDMTSWLAGRHGLRTLCQQQRGAVELLIGGFCSTDAYTGDLKARLLALKDCLVTVPTAKTHPSKVRTRVCVRSPAAVAATF